MTVFSMTVTVTMTDHDRDPAEIALPGEAEERRHLLAGALRLLEGEFTPATWKAFAETMLRGRPVEEVAAELGLTPNAVYVARSRVLKRLRQEPADLLE